jgi:excisionase family DNA binding protein
VPSKTLLTVSEAADRLSVGRSRLYEEVSSGRLRSVRIGRRRLIPVDALTDYVELLSSENPVPPAA